MSRRMPPIGGWALFGDLSGTRIFSIEESLHGVQRVVSSNLTAPTNSLGLRLALRRFGGIFGTMPRKIRQLVADLEKAGFVLVPGGRGSHRKFRHPKFPGSLILSGQAGDDAKHY